MTRDRSTPGAGDREWGLRALDALPGLLVVNDLNGRLLYRNEPADGWPVATPSTTADEIGFEHWPVNLVERLAALDAKVVADRSVVREMAAIRGVDGGERRFFVEKFPVQDGSGAVVGIGTTATDVTDLRNEAGESSTDALQAGAPDTRDGSDGRDHDERAVRDVERSSLEHEARERQRAERELQASRRHLQTLTDSLPVLVVHYDEALRYRFVNRTYCSWRQVEPESVLGRSVEETVEPALYEKTRSYLERALAGERVRFEYEAAFPDGHTRLIHGDVIPERDASGRVIGAFGVGTDVTQLVELERKLRRSDRLAAVGQVTATVAHELRTPLGTIAASSAMLGRLCRDGVPGVAPALDRIERNVTRCNSIIEELLSYTRVRQVDLARTKVDEWLAAHLDELEFPPDVALRRSLESGAEADIDPHRLGQALGNLVDNALGATYEPGAVVSQPRLEIRTRTNADRVEILVTDNGTGIRPGLGEQIFEPLFSTRTIGVGLGLPLVRQIMSEHHGGVEVSETGPLGTTMLLWMPLAQVPANGSPRTDA